MYRIAFLVGVGIGLAPVSALQAQQLLSGRLFLADSPADSGTVVLHSVNPEEAGPVDSVRVGPDGHFVFDLSAAPTPGEGQSVFVTHRHDGILYFGDPIFSSDALPEEYPVHAYRTRPVPTSGLPLPIETRTLIVEDGPGVWQVTDVIRIHNDSSVTWVPNPAGEGRVWQYPLPPDAESPRLVDPGTGVEGIAFDGTNLVSTGSIPPGDRVFVVRYGLPSLGTSIPLAGRTESVELLVSEAAPLLDVPGMVASEPIEMEGGARYRRWVAEDVRDRVIRISLDPRAGGGMPPGAIAGVVSALVLIVAGAWFVRRDP